MLILHPSTFVIGLGLSLQCWASFSYLRQPWLPKPALGLGYLGQSWSLGPKSLQLTPFVGILLNRRLWASLILSKCGRPAYWRRVSWGNSFKGLISRPKEVGRERERERELQVWREIRVKVKTSPMTTNVRVGLLRQRLRQQLVGMQGNPPTNKLRAQIFRRSKKHHWVTH